MENPTFFPQGHFASLDCKANTIFQCFFMLEIKIFEFRSNYFALDSFSILAQCVCVCQSHTHIVHPRKRPERKVSLSLKDALPWQQFCVHNAEACESFFPLFICKHIFVFAFHGPAKAHTPNENILAISLAVKKRNVEKFIVGWCGKRFYFSDVLISGKRQRKTIQGEGRDWRVGISGKV